MELEYKSTEREYSLQKDKFKAIMAIYTKYLEQTLPLNLPHSISLTVNIHSVTIAVFENVNLIGNLGHISIDNSGFWDHGDEDLYVLESLTELMSIRNYDRDAVERLLRKVDI